MTNYKLIEGYPVSSVVAFFPGRSEPLKQADANHPHWNTILQGLADNNDGVYELFDVRKGLNYRLTQLSDRVSYDGENILFDGDVVNDALSQQVLRFLEEGVQDYKPLVNFWEKIAQNPSEHSRDSLYKWLQAEKFSITSEGDIVAYKGVESDVEDGVVKFRSKNAGTALVDGLEIKGKIPNMPGTVVSMPRSEVSPDYNIGCHTGLHVGTQKYATSFGRVLLEVHVNPRDVVSVPVVDCHKMRVCKYTVVQVLKDKKKYTEALVVPAEDYVAPGWRGDVGYSVDAHESGDWDDYGF